MLDVDCSGTLDFDEFYLLVCILIAVQDKDEKHFIYRHSRTVFDLLDEDASGNISCHEFEKFGFLFNLQGEAMRTIFSEFDVSGDHVSLKQTWVRRRLQSGSRPRAQSRNTEYT